MLTNRVRRNIAENGLIEAGECVLVGVSGGSDSVALLRILCELSNEMSFKLVAAHVNHLLRGTESEQDEQFVRVLCGELGVPLVLKKVDVATLAKENKMSVEECAREIRYHFFREELKKLNGDKIAVAHHEGDQLETILMNILRGTGSEGLLGMQFLSGDLVRPFLNISKNEIEEYLFINKINSRIDSSNFQTIYTRNKIRLKLIPFIRENFAIDVSSGLLRLSEILRDENDFIRERVLYELNQITRMESPNEIQIDGTRFLGLHVSLQKRIIREIIQKIKGNLTNLAYNNIMETIGLIKKQKTGTGLDLPGGIRVRLSYDRVKIFMRRVESEKPKLNTQLILDEEFYVDGVAKMNASVLEANAIETEYLNVSAKEQCQYFDYDKIIGIPVIRNRLEGDIFKPSPGSGTKKLKKYFIDLKWDIEARDKAILLTLGNEVIWIVGFARSENYKVTKSTKKILKITYELVN